MATKKTAEPVSLQLFQGTKMEQLKQLYETQWYGCQRCVLSGFRIDGAGNPFKDITFGDGNPNARVMIIGEAPGEEEELCGVPFIGPSGRLLNQILAATSDDVGIQELFRWYNTGRRSKDNEKHFHEKMLEWRRQEFFVTNIVGCRPPDNRTPTHPEVKACWERLLNIIYIVDPWFIITLGRPAIETLVRKQIEVTKLRGTIFDVEIPGRRVPYKIPTMACLHPSYLLRQADWKSKTGTFMKTVRDFHSALRYVDGMKLHHLGVPMPVRPEL
jgi:DNA polymerase